MRRFTAFRSTLTLAVPTGKPTDQAAAPSVISGDRPPFKPSAPKPSKNKCKSPSILPDADMVPKNLWPISKPSLPPSEHPNNLYISIYLINFPSQPLASAPAPTASPHKPSTSSSNSIAISKFGWNSVYKPSTMPPSNAFIADTTGPAANVPLSFFIKQIYPSPSTPFSVYPAKPPPIFKQPPTASLNCPYKP